MPGKRLIHVNDLWLGWLLCLTETTAEASRNRLQQASAAACNKRQHNLR